MPPWTYQAGYSQQVLSPSEARRQALRAEAGLPPTVEAAPLKTREAPFRIFSLRFVFGSINADSSVLSTVSENRLRQYCVASIEEEEEGEEV